MLMAVTILSHVGIMSFSHQLKKGLRGEDGRRVEQKVKSRKAFTKRYKTGYVKTKLAKRKPPEGANQNLLVTLVEAPSTSECLKMASAPL